MERTLRTGVAGLISALLIMTSVMVVSPPSARAVTDENPSFRLIPADLEFMLKQIQIAESHAAGNPLLCDEPTDTSGKCVPDPTLPFGLRTVDGSFNNLANIEYGAADRPFPRLLEPPVWRDAEAPPTGAPPNPPGATEPCGGGSATCYEMHVPGSFVYDSEPRVISNLIVDQTVDNPAAMKAYEQMLEAGAAIDAEGRIFIPNTAPDEELSASFNMWFVFFGQFFDHGLDLVNKGGNGTLIVPLDEDDPLYARTPPGQRFLMLTRATRLPGPDGIVGTEDDEHNNQTTPFVDQNQTYTSHPAHQVFLREYTLEDIDGDGDLEPLDTGRLLSGPDVDGDGLGDGLATWNDVKAQARDVLGIDLVDADVLNVPMVATDVYGNFLAGSNGYPVIVNADGSQLEGNPAAPASTANAIDTNHAFLDDIAHGAAPDPNGLSGYDNVALGEHFVTGDGRGNENIGLTAVHHVFHSEHNRLIEHIKGVLAENPELEKAYRGESHTWTALMGDPLPQPEADDWTYEQRLFQAARFATEMQYQHLVFEEYARRIQPAIDEIVFNENSYDATIDPAIMAEFAHVVYRFGHSMLTDEVAREGFGTDTLSLFDAFLNPAAYDMNGALTPDEAAGAVINGTTNQVANQIDELVVDTLRNNLLGLPLDLPAINILRGRDAGVPPLQEARRIFFEATGDPLLEPYESWTDFGLHLRNGNLFGRGESTETLVNFIAAYGTHPTLQAATTLEEKREAANLIVNGTANGGAFVTRIAGANRFDTAALVSRSQFTAGVPVVFVANGKNFPDALAGAPAAADANGPILLVNSNGIPRETAVELNRLDPKSIVVLGGPAAVNDAVVETLESYTSGDVTRLAGPDRFATAAAVSKATFGRNVPVAYVASGLNFPDALSGAAVASRDGAPILLVTKDEVPSATAVELSRLRPERIVVLGGPAVVNDDVLRSLDLRTPGDATRLAGANRYETAVAVSKASFEGSEAAFVATGLSFPDALAAAPVAGRAGAPLLLLPKSGIPADVQTELDRLDTEGVSSLGGTAAISVSQEAQLNAMAAAGPDDRLAFMNSEPGTLWASTNGVTNTGLENVDFWVGGLAEQIDPFGGMLGSTFNFVFEQQLENLQFGDRFYYLFRNQGNQLFAALEANSFSGLIQRNTDASLLPADIFSIQEPLDIENLPTPWPDQLTQDNTGMYIWDGDEHIEMHGHRTLGDRIRGGQGDDALWGYGGDDRIEGGSGNDTLLGGSGNDILTDTFGDDTLKGGLGNDAMNGGAGEDLLLGEHGDDFLMAATDSLKDMFAGTGDDIVLGGSGRENVFGGEGDDWIEGGPHADLVQGDNANQFQNDPNGGADVIIGGPGNDDHDSDGGDDIMVGQFGGVDRFEGMLGFDWVTYRGERTGVDIDMRFSVLQRPDVQAVRDRYDLIESVSGGDGDDVIRGMGHGMDDQPDGFTGHKLTEEGIDRIDGLRAMLDPGHVTNYAHRFMDIGIPTDSDGVSNILLGGRGSDMIEGRIGDDFIDGDAYLNVELEYDGQRYTTAADLAAAVFDGAIDPGDIAIVREIVLPTDQAGVLDTAVYAADSGQYEITDLGDGYWQVTHVNPDVELEESEGSDVLRNVELLQFGDGCFFLGLTDELGNPIPCPSYGTATLHWPGDAPTEDVEMGATVVFNSEIASPTDIRFRWQFAEAGEEWEPSSITLADSCATNADGLFECTTSFTPSDLEAGGNILRVIVTFLDDSGQLSSIVSAPTAEEDGVVNVNDEPELLVLDPTSPSVGSVVRASNLVDADGISEVIEDGTLSWTWQQSTCGSGAWSDIVTQPAAVTGFIPTMDQLGDCLRVVASYTDDQGEAETAVSLPTDPVAPGLGTP